MNYLHSCVAVGVLGFVGLHGIEKTEQGVFEKWQSWQECYGHPALNSLIQNATGSYWNSFKHEYKTASPLVRDSRAFLSWLTHGGIARNGSIAQVTLDAQAQKNLTHTFNLLEHDMGGFLQLLKSHYFYNQRINKREQAVHFQKVIDKDVAFLKLLFAQPDNHRRDEYLFSFANHVFEFCFSPKTWPIFKHMLDDRSRDSLNRFVYATIWSYLVGEGWHNWSNECLAKLHACAVRGENIVYIAGGSDVYQLLKNGVYNITVIDPQLPSQDTYYTNNWEWLVKGDGKRGGVGDRFTMNTAHGQLLLKRVTYKVHGAFSTELSTGQTVQLPQSTTQWNVYDDQHVYKGRILFERRFCQHQDLLPKPHQTLLFSFNEMYYAALGKELGGWDVRPQKLPASFTTFVKQLRMPVGKQVLAYLRVCESSQFNFIRLGSVPT